ncbi:MAG: signal peptide peptidase SppA [Proteobacteria bacterium]|nr:signal peptide peptidase SppA [Pseudomonadota bacterium]
MKKSMKQSFIVIVCAVFLFCSGCAFVNLPLTGYVEPLEEKTLTGKGKNKILLIDVSGVITEENKKSLSGLSTEINPVARIKEELEKASRDKRIKALLLRIDSPGGTVTACDIIHQEIMRFKKKNNIYVAASFMNIAASGGYYIATAADSITAHPTTITGSIGVIVIKFNIKGLMDKVGVQEESIKSGDKKDILSPFRGSTPEERKIVQDIIDSLYQKFLAVIAEGRKDIAKDELKRLADGRVFTARQALDAKLIDSIGYLDDTIDMVKKQTGLEEARVITYYRPTAYKNNIYSQANIQLFNIGGGEFTGYLPVRFMYLWNP